MRKYPILFVVLALALSGCSGAYDRELLGDPEPAAVATPPASQQEVPAEEAATPAYSDGVINDPLPSAPTDYGMFGEMDPYGQWYETDGFGPVWRPAMGAGWQPYVSGHWIWTSYGWMWVSYEPFGWATYHYGTWWLDPVLGWIWVPDYQWAACPVDWFVAGDYLGWAPIAPPGCSWDDPWSDYGRYKDGWVVVETGKFKEVDVGENRVTPQRFKSAYRTGTAVRQSPETRTIETATRQTIRETNVRIDSERYGTRELKKVILPAHEQQIVERFPMPVLSPGPTQSLPTVTPPPPSGGKTKEGAKPQTRSAPPAKAKSKGSSGSARSKSGAKDKGGEEKSKGDDKNNDDKGDGDKPKDDKPKDDGKDKGSSTGKAKGRKG